MSSRMPTSRVVSPLPSATLVARSMKGNTKVESSEKKLSLARARPSADRTAASSGPSMPSGLTLVVPLEHAAATQAASTSPTPTFRMPISIVNCLVLLADARFGFRGMAGGAERPQRVPLIDAAGVPQDPRRDPQLLGGADLLADLHRRVPWLAPPEGDRLQIRPHGGRVRNIACLLLSIPRYSERGHHSAVSAGVHPRAN